MNEMTKSPVASPLATRSSLPDGGPIGWLRGEIDRLFEDFGRPAPGIFNFGTRVPALVPAMELVDDDKEYRLSAELPGLTDKDVEINVDQGVLTISGEKKEESERKDNGFLLSERRYGSFKRQIALPSDVAPDSIKARFTNGVLNVTLGKDKKAQERLQKIPIET
jgi:HSP20 family protein